MLKTLITTLALAMAAAVYSPSQAGEPTCGSEPAPRCCSKCGCHEGMVPVCHTYWTTKKVTKYCYHCICEDKCIPGCCKCDHPPCDSCGCNDNCGCKENCGCDKCHCMIVEVHKLVKVAHVEEEPVRKCYVEWVCPQCGCHNRCDGCQSGCNGCQGNCDGAAAPAENPPVPLPSNRKTAAYGPAMDSPNSPVAPAPPMKSGAGYAY